MLATLLALALSASLQDASAAKPATTARSQRWYEADLRADSPTGPYRFSSGLSAAELSAELTAGRYDGLVVWLPASAGIDAPREPRAREVDAAAVPEALRGSLKPLLEGRVRIALGLGDGDALEAARSFGASTFRSIVVVGAAGATELTRVARPALRSLLWFDPDFCRRSGAPSSASGMSLSERPLQLADEPLRPIQARLDLAAWSDARASIADGPVPADASEAVATRIPLDRAAFARLRLQSRLISDVATWLAGATPDRLDVLANEWSGGPPPDEPVALRRTPPWLDLEETLLSPGSFGTADAPGLVLGDDTASEPGDPSDGPVVAGVLAAGEIEGLRSLVAARREATRHFGRFLLFGDRSERDATVAALARCGAAAARLGTHASAWVRGLEADRDLVAALEPWRCSRVQWSVAPADRPDSPIHLENGWIDDERVLGFARIAAEAFGGERVRLSRAVALDPMRPLLLRTELPLADPRVARCEIAGGGRITVKVNGAEQVGRFDATAQPLVTTLPLAAGRNVLEIELVPSPRASDPSVRLLLLPHAIEGLTIEPRRALRTAEPVVRLRDPAALTEESLVWPEGRTVGSETSGSADLPFEPLWNGRTDVWLHVLGGGSAAGRLEVGLDDQIGQALAIPRGERWQWLRLPAPLPVSSGAHRLVLRFRTPGVRVDLVTCFETGIGFPHRPNGEGTLSDAAWRFDPLGSGLVVDLPSLAAGDLFGRTFTVDKTATYQVFVWLRGRDPLQPGETSEVDLNSTTTRTRFVVPFGTAYEEWVSVGSVSLMSDERVELRARGRGALSRVALTR